MERPSGVSLREALRTWLYIGLNSFGGPAGQIGVMHRVLVDEKRWLGEARFLHALNFCMLLPGPEAMQLATYVGWLMHGTAGGLAAGILFVLPGFLVMLALSAAYATWRHVPVADALFLGIKAAVLAIVIDAVIRIGKRALRSGALAAVAAGAFVAIAVLAIPFPWIVLAAGVLGFLAARRWPRPSALGARVSSGSAPHPQARTLLGDEIPAHARASPARTLRVLVLGLAVWFAPLAAIVAFTGRESVFVDLGLFFSKAAVVTFGGAYAVLAYVAEQAVEVRAWLAPGEMLDGLGLAETTPGPLILVLEFVGFMAAWRRPGGLDPALAGTLGAVVTTWVTFVPCFLWIFAGAPYVERLRANVRLGASLAAITAAVVGVILHLALWFGMHVLFARIEDVSAVGLTIHVPRLDSVQPLPLAIAAAAMVAMLRFKVGVLWTLAGAAAATLLAHALL